MLHLKSANHELTQLQLELPVDEVLGGGRLMTVRGEDIPRLLKFNLHVVMKIPRLYLAGEPQLYFRGHNSSS